MDNIVSARFVTASGAIVEANATAQPALWRALRGSGGSAFGVIVALTLQTHDVPSGGLVSLSASVFGAIGDVAGLTRALYLYSTWALSLNKHWSGLAFVVPNTTVWQVARVWAV